MLARHREIAATGGAALAVVIAGSAYAVVGPGSAHQGSGQALSRVSDSRSAAGPKPTKAPPPPPPKPLYMTSVTPGHDSNGTVDGTKPITVTFSSPLSPDSALPAVYPKIHGSWKVSGDKATFTPETGFQPGTTVSVTTRAGTRGTGASPRVVALKSQTKSFTTGGYSELRLEELLAQLGYLPVTFNGSSVPSGDAKAQLSAAYDPPSGSFGWSGSYPGQLEGLWKTGAPNLITSGAVRAFEAVNGLTMDGQAGPEVWSYLLAAVARGQHNPNGYTYALATQGPGGGQNLQVWHNGSHILSTPANMGVAGGPTADGTYPVFDRLPFQVMKGKNPDGTKYADPVHWIAYFNGGDAIHGFQRASYGSYQSVGCVEIPVSTAQWLYQYLTYGTLVTVQGQPA